MGKYNAKWELFEYVRKNKINAVELSKEIDRQFKEVLLEAAYQSISRSKGKIKRVSSLAGGQ